jgi:dienelactone hydrolase
MRFLLAAWPLLLLANLANAEPLPDTTPLMRQGDLAAQMVAGIDKYLMREVAASVDKRRAYWKPDFSSEEAYAKSLQPNREHLKKMLGVVDPRVQPVEMELVATTTRPALVAEAPGYKVFAVRWPVLPGVDGEGLLLEPAGAIKANVVALQDADSTPEAIVGLAPGSSKGSPFALRLAEQGCRVIVPVLIDREDTWSGNPKLGRMTNQPHREFVYRMAYEMGRHIIGYEVQRVLAAVDWCQRQHPALPVGVFGYGEGAMLALYTGAIDERIRVAGVSNYFAPREALWREPIFRNVSGLLREFGDAELVALMAPRAVVVEQSRYLEWLGPTVSSGRAGAAPGQLRLAPLDDVQQEWKRAEGLLSRLPKSERMGNTFVRVETGEGDKAPVPSGDALAVFARRLLDIRTPNEVVKELRPATDPRKGFDPALRQKRQFDQLCDYTQKLMRDSEARRAETFWARLDTSSVAKYAASTESFRKQLDEEVIGKLPEPTLPPNPRSRQVLDEQNYRGYEVTLDLYPDVFAYGILLLPKDLKPGEKRPVVVCQHGLEGRPTDVINPAKKTTYYNSFGSTLADRGYIVYAPQNPYIGHDDFRVLQRKANPLGLSLFSFIVRQHATTLDWLATLPNVDPERIAFYGLSYGGKTAMRVPALLPRYCLSICSGDFNEWTWKNASTDYRGSYMFSPEYEMPEFNMGHTLVYAEMAALIAPRPFMVERGHDDGVGIDEWVAFEYAKVRRLYSKLHIPDRTALEFFPGGHEIHLQGTADFLRKHLHWPPS